MVTILQIIILKRICVCFVIIDAGDVQENQIFNAPNVRLDISYGLMPPIVHLLVLLVNILMLHQINNNALHVLIHAHLVVL